MSNSEINPLIQTLGEQFFQELPRAPGVYFMLGASERVLYIGKAKSLRARLRSYARAKPGAAEDRTLEMIAQVRSIRCERHATEKRALAREADLLRVLKPPYNIAGTDDELFLYIGIRCIRRASGFQVEFRLSNWPDFPGLPKLPNLPNLQEEGFEVFGGYRNRGKVKRSYSALLRLIYAYQCKGSRFSYPARISREQPPWLYKMRFPQELEAPLRDFLSGKNRKLLTKIFEGLLINESIPVFMRPSIQDDIEVVKLLFTKGPRTTNVLRRRHGLKVHLVRPEEMNEVIEKEVLG